MGGGHLQVFNTGKSVFIGEGAGANDDLSDKGNTAVGYYSLNDNTTGQANTAIGYKSLLENTTGQSNTALGAVSLFYNTTGEMNTAIGRWSMQWNNTGNRNTTIGYQTLHENTTGDNNTAVGANALFWNEDGSKNTAIGYKADIGEMAEVGWPSNATAIGANALVQQDNSMVLGSINGINGATSNVHVGIGLIAPGANLHVFGNSILEGKVNITEWQQQSLSEDGYAKVGSVLIQWGKDFSDSDGDEDFDFPTNFPNACFSVIVQRMESGGKNILPVIGWTDSKFTINRNNDLGDSDFCWIAIGY